MFSGKKLSAIQRRKRTIVARSDLLRAECGEVWDAAERRVVSTGPFRKLRRLSPLAVAISLAGLSFARTKLLARHRVLGAACSVAGAALMAARRER